MRGLVVTVIMTVGGWLGWWLGDFLGLFGAVTLSMVGTGVGLYYGRRLVQYLP